jgi:hypothetical protein
MKYKPAVILLDLITLILLCVASRGFADEPEVVEVEGGEAKMTLAEGNADLFCRKAKLRRPLSEGDLLRHGDRVTTGDKTRVELAVPDGTVSEPFRFDPRVDADDWVRWKQMRDQMQ